MKKSPRCFSRCSLFYSFITLTFLLLSSSTASAEQVTISPNKIISPTFHTSTAACYGAYANTHINLGYVLSTTGEVGHDRECCTVGGGLANTASGDYSTVIGGLSNIASGKYSTVGGGYANKAGGECSWAGGYAMSLTETADHTFVWGHSNVLTSIVKDNAFLIFPTGTPGKVGIGTSNPEQIMHVVGVNPRILVEASSANPEVNFKNTGDATNVIWALYKHSTTDDFRFWQNGDRITIQSQTGNFGIGRSDPEQKLDIAGGNGRVESGYNWLTNSDVRLKKDISTLNNSLDKISHIRGVRFNSNKDNFTENSIGKHIGVVAQELENEYPELVVDDDKTGYKAVAYDKLTAVLIEAVKELKKQNQSQKEVLEKQQAEIEELRSMIKDLKNYHQQIAKR